jgi:hypothetical protein
MVIKSLSTVAGSTGWDLGNALPLFDWKERPRNYVLFGRRNPLDGAIDAGLAFEGFAHSLLD